MPLRLTRNSTVGLGVLVAAAVVIAWGLAGKPAPSGDRSVWVELRDVTTLGRFDRDVRVGGVNAGTIGRVERRADHVRVELRLRPEVARTIRADASAELRPHTLFDGSAFVELRPGSPSAPTLGARAIAVDRTQQPVSLDEALRTFSPALRRDLPRLTRDVRRTLRPGATRALRRTLTGAPDLLAALTPALRAAQGPTRSELAGAVHGAARTARAVARAEADIGPALGAARPTLRALRGSGTELDRTLAGLPGALRAGAAGAASLRRTTIALRPLARDLPPALRQLGPALRELRPLAREARPVLAAARPFLRELRGLLSAARAHGPATSELLRALLPGVERLAGEVVPLLNARTARGTTVVESLAGAASGAAGTLAMTSKRNGQGIGHGWHMTPSTLTPTGPGCASIPDETLRRRFEELSLCVP